MQRCVRIGTTETLKVEIDAAGVVAGNKFWIELELLESLHAC